MKLATWFLVTREFIPGFRVFWRSLLMHNPREIFGEVVIQTDAYSEWMQCELGDFRFWPYDPHRWVETEWPAYSDGVRPCYARLEALECQDYDRITVMDADMVCTGSIADAMDYDVPFVGVGVDSEANPRRRFNGGFWTAQKPVIGNPHAMRELKEIVTTGRAFDKCDQSALLCYLDDRNIKPCLLPSRYNLQIGWPEEAPLKSYYLAERHDCRILHFIGRKPWDSEYPHMNKRELWRPLWDRAAAGEKLTAADVVAVEVGE
jgi:hypothetical protein